MQRNTNLISYRDTNILRILIIQYPVCKNECEENTVSIPPPTTTVSCVIVFLEAPTSAARGFQPQAQEAESIMLNVAGKLLMFQRDRSGPQVKTSKDSKDRPVSFTLFHLC